MCQCWAVLEGRVPGWCWALGALACGGGSRQGLTASSTGRRHAGVLTDAHSTAFWLKDSYTHKQLREEKHFGVWLHPVLLVAHAVSERDVSVHDVDHCRIRLRRLPVRWRMVLHRAGWPGNGPAVLQLQQQVGSTLPGPADFASL